MDLFLFALTVFALTVAPILSLLMVVTLILKGGSRMGTQSDV